MAGTKYGKKKTISFGIAGLVLCFGIISQLHSILIIRLIFVLCGFFWAMININSYPFVIDMAPKGQVGKYTGLYYIASSVAAIVSPPLLGFVIDFIGYKCMFVYGTIFFIISLLCILKVKNISNE
jgi:MFS family permease